MSEASRRRLPKSSMPVNTTHTTDRSEALRATLIIRQAHLRTRATGVVQPIMLAIPLRARQDIRPKAVDEPRRRRAKLWSGLLTQSRGSPYDEDHDLRR